MEQVATPDRPGRPAPLSGYLWEGKKQHGSRIVHPPGMLEFLVLLLGAVRAGLRGRDKLLWVLAHRLCPSWHRHLVLVRRRWWSAGIAQRGSCPGAGSLAPVPAGPA